jgi:Fe-S oxidoreductase
MMAARALLLDAGRVSLEDYRTFLVDQDWHFFTLYRDTYDIHYNDLDRDSYETLFFPGCSLASYAPELTRAAHAWLEDQGELMGLSDQCCGLLLSSIGLKDRATQHVARLRQQISAAGASKLVTACSGCHSYLKTRLQGVEVVSLYEMMAQAGMRLSGNLLLTVHDSCPDRSEGIIGRQVRHLLAGYSLVEMRHHGAHTICCGSGGLVSVVEPKLCTERSRARMVEFTASGADRCVTACMACANRLSRAAREGSVVHCLELVFNQRVDHAHVQAKAQAMWEGEWGEYNLYRLAHARPVTAVVKR